MAASVGNGYGRIDLSHASDFRLGPAMVHPSLLTIEAEGRTETLEPKVMQVLVALHRASGAPVSRDDLIKECWNGLALSDDAITQCVSKLRRALGAVPGVSVTSVARVGYRLVAEATLVAHPASPLRLPLGRLAMTTIGVALIGGALLAFGPFNAQQTSSAETISARGSPPQTVEASRLHDAAVRLFRERTREGYAESERQLRRAVALDPQSAPSWARLAMAVWAPYWWKTQDDPSARARLYSESLGYAKRALALDRNSAEANQAMAFVNWYKEPLPWIERAAALAPNDGEIAYQLAQVLENRLELRRALAQAEHALILDPTLPRVIRTTALLRLRLGHRVAAYDLIDQLGRLTHRANENRTARFEMLFEEGRLAEAAALCAQSLALKDQDSWWAQQYLVEIASRLGDRGLRDQMLQSNPKLGAVIAFETPIHSLNLARSAPNEWWADLSVGGLARQLVNNGSGSELLTLYDNRYDSADDLWRGGHDYADTLAPPLIVAMRRAGRTVEATELRGRWAADIAKLKAEADRSAHLPVAQAQLAAIDGDAAAAAHWLDIAVDGGWKAQSTKLGFGPDRDPAFAAVRSDLRMVQAIARYQAAIGAEAAALARLRLSRSNGRSGPNGIVYEANDSPPAFANR